MRYCSRTYGSFEYCIIHSRFYQYRGNLVLLQNHSVDVNIPVLWFSFQHHKFLNIQNSVPIHPNEDDIVAPFHHISCVVLKLKISKKLYHTKLFIQTIHQKYPLKHGKMDIYSLVHCPCIEATHYNDGDGSCDQCCMWRNIDSNLTSLTKLYLISPWRGHVSHQVDCQFDLLRFKLGLTQGENRVKSGWTKILNCVSSLSLR